MQTFPGTAAPTSQSATLPAAGRVRDFGPRRYSDPLLPTVPLGSGAYSFHNASSMPAMADNSGPYPGGFSFDLPAFQGADVPNLDWGLNPIGFGTPPSTGVSLYANFYGGSGGSGGGSWSSGGPATYLGFPPETANDSIYGVGLSSPPAKSVVELWMKMRNPNLLWNRNANPAAVAVPHDILDGDVHEDTTAPVPIPTRGSMIFRGPLVGGDTTWMEMLPVAPAANATGIIGPGPQWKDFLSFAGDSEHYKYSWLDTGTELTLLVDKEFSHEAAVSSGATEGYLEDVIVDLGTVPRWIVVTRVSDTLRITHATGQATATTQPLAGVTNLLFDGAGHFTGVS